MRKTVADILIQENEYFVIYPNDDEHNSPKNNF